jgi:hypothetical protein
MISSLTPSTSCGSSGIRFSVPGMVPPITHSVGAVPVFNRTVMQAGARLPLTGHLERGADGARRRGDRFGHVPQGLLADHGFRAAALPDFW